MLHIVFNFIYLGKRAQILHLGCSLYSSRLHLYKWQFLWVPHKDGVRDFFGGGGVVCRKKRFGVEFGNRTYSRCAWAGTTHDLNHILCINRRNAKIKRFFELNSMCGRGGLIQTSITHTAKAPEVGVELNLKFNILFNLSRHHLKSQQKSFSCF